MRHDVETNAHDASPAAAGMGAWAGSQPRGPSGFPQSVAIELAGARRKHATPVASLHEGYAIIQEELNELWDLVRRKSRDRSNEAIYEELVQIAAMAQRVADDLGIGTRAMRSTEQTWFQQLQHAQLESRLDRARVQAVNEEMRSLIRETERLEATLARLQAPAAKRKKGGRP